VGSLLPEVTLYDEHGEEFSTTSLREHYSVLVFGCLT
jgi:cytochrome oxidase Cu insertion factor (SCO1/SenC/PrrC family)